MSSYDDHACAVQEIANTMEVDIAKGLNPKPEKVHNDYWIIEEWDTPHSYHSFAGYRMYDSQEEAYAFLSSIESVVPAPAEIRAKYWSNEPLIYASTDKYMSDTPNNEAVPVLYRLHHCEYDAYPTGVEVSNLSEEGVALMIEAYTAVRKAQIYIQMAEDLNDGESAGTAREKVNEQIEKLTEEIDQMDWSEFLDDDDE